MKKQYTFIFMILCLCLTIESSAQYNPKNVCRIEDNKTIFRLDRRWTIKQQKEIERLEDFVARNKARAATATLAKSRQKKLDKMDIIERTKEKMVLSGLQTQVAGAFAVKNTEIHELRLWATLSHQ